MSATKREVSPQAEKGPQIKKKRTAKFYFKDMQIMLQIVAKCDPNRLISSANKDSGILAKKKVIWDQILTVRV